MVTYLWFIDNKRIVVVSFIIYLLSLTQKCYVQYPSNNDTSVGWALLVLGWIGLDYHCYVWLANPFLFVSWWFMFRGYFKSSIAMSLISICLMLSFLSYRLILVRVMPDIVYGRIVGYEAGYWLWVASAFVLIVGDLILVVRYYYLVSDK
jgi:hypothetical protein